MKPERSNLSSSYAIREIFKVFKIREHPNITYRFIGQALWNPALSLDSTAEFLIFQSSFFLNNRCHQMHLTPSPLSLPLHQSVTLSRSL